jgi:hypothetical protein
MAGNFSSSLYLEQKSKSPEFLYLSSKSLSHCISFNSIYIIPGASSTSILNGVVNIFSNVSFDLKYCNPEMNSELRTERAVQYF